MGVLFFHTPPALPRGRLEEGEGTQTGTLPLPEIENNKV